MRSYRRDINLGDAPQEEIAAAGGMSGRAIEDMYRLVAIADYTDRYVIPTTHGEIARTSAVTYGLLTGRARRDRDVRPGNPRPCPDPCAGR